LREIISPVTIYSHCIVIMGVRKGSAVSACEALHRESEGSDENMLMPTIDGDSGNIYTHMSPQAYWSPTAVSKLHCDCFASINPKMMENVLSWKYRRTSQSSGHRHKFHRVQISLGCRRLPWGGVGAAYGLPRTARGLRHSGTG
jgi:hypothetical protein